MKNLNKYPIKVVSSFTGLSVHVIRAWEKRYNVVNPKRTETNRRLYSKEDMEKLKLLAEACARGYSIGSLSNYSIDVLKELIGVSKSEKDDNSKLNVSDNALQDTHLEKCINAVKNLDSISLEREIYAALKEFSQPKFIDLIILPLLEKIGEMWKIGEIRIVNEHVSTAVIRKILMSLIDNNVVPLNAPVIVVATPKGQLHELGALIIGVVASSEGWNVTYMGPNLPGEEIAAAIDKLKPKIVALSIVYPSDDHTLDNEMIKLKKLLNNGSKIIAGGRSAMTYEKTLKHMNATIMTDISEFRKELEFSC